MKIFVTNLNKSYKEKKALNEVNLELEKGSFTAIVGPSGCGKTTLLRCLAGFLTVDSGRILFGDEDVTDVSPQNRGTAMVFQNYALWPHMTVYNNIAYGLKLRKNSKDEIERKVNNILKKVEIDTKDVKHRYPTQYSGGQQQRIALARALVLEPKLLLMDEPLSNLDAKVRQRLRIEIRRLQKELGITAVYVTHDQEEALSMAEQVVLMNNGVVEQMGTPEELYYQPKSYFVAHFLGKSNTLEIEKKEEKYYLGKQLVNIPKNFIIEENKELSLVIRSDEIKMEGEEDPKNCILLEGELMESLFVGSGYRHWLMVEKQSIYIENEKKLMNKDKCKIFLPLQRCNIFPREETKGVAIIEA
ncbi:MAG: ABC transporter ATP-binding protein [Thermotaleaceae bacterium]